MLNDGPYVFGLFLVIWRDSKHNGHEVDILAETTTRITVLWLNRILATTRHIALDRLRR